MAKLRIAISPENIEDFCQRYQVRRMSLFGSVLRDDFEAAARLPETFQTQQDDIEWSDIIGFRNIAVHEYFLMF